MSTILERVESLIALAGSSNENEARNAAMLAVQLIRKHRLVLSMPSRQQPAAPAARRDPRRESPPPTPKRPRSSKGVKRAVDPPEKIVAPLGGECFHCHGRYRRDTPIYWFAARGGMHLRCFDEWSRDQR